jgi:hypothetical protein
MPSREPETSERARRKAQALSRWTNEGGAGEGGLAHPASTLPEPEALPLTNAELVQLQVLVEEAAWSRHPPPEAAARDRRSERR